MKQKGYILRKAGLVSPSVGGRYLSSLKVSKIQIWDDNDLRGRNTMYLEDDSMDTMGWLLSETLFTNVLGPLFYYVKKKKK